MEYMIRPYQNGEERYVADLHKKLYAKEYSWGPNFTDYAMEIALDFAKKDKCDREELFIADAEGQPVGCIMLCETDDPDIGQLRLFAVEKDYRRFGIGSALIRTFMEKARSSGYKKIILWTASPLTAAIRHYKRLGFQIVDSVENNDWSTEGIPVEEIKMEMNMIS